MLEYRSVADLDEAIVRSLGKFGPDVDLVVGIPRSGMLPATLLALYLDVPVVDLDAYVRGWSGSRGERLSARRAVERESASSRPRRIVVMDDSVDSGGAMSAVRERMRALPRPADEVVYAAVFVRSDQTSLVDVWCDLLGPQRVFEWNVMNHELLAASCVDIDGVVCRDPTEEENDDGERYLRFIESVPVLRRPAYPIRCLVTSRLERYRTPTVEWLERAGIVYDELAMMDLPTREARERSNSYGSFKAATYRRTNAVLFIESSRWQADEIAKLTRKPVYCVEDRAMVYHNSVESIQKLEISRGLMRSRVSALVPEPVKRLGRRVLRRLSKAG